MPEQYPSSLPGILVAKNINNVQYLVKRNDLQSGPPIYRLECDEGWSLFNVGWTFTPEEKQIFDNWYRWTLRQGSKSFEIGIMVDGSNGISNTRIHTCYFDPEGPLREQNQTLWNVNATLLAIEQETDDEEFAEQLIILSNGFPDGVLLTMLGLDEIIQELEELWPA